MLILRIVLVTGSILLAHLLAQDPLAVPAPLRIGPGVTPPRLLKKVEPTYPNEARNEHVQGTVVLQIVVTEQGLSGDIKVISPLGYGLDEKAEEAVRKWRFAPGEKDGRPVSVQATIEVNFRLNGLSFDHKLEERRTRYNEAAALLNQSDPVRKENAVKSIQSLAGEDYPAAMYALGMWQISGDHVAVDTAGGLAWLQKAADKKYGPALYQIAIRLIRGEEFPVDSEKGIMLMHEAAKFGSDQAQFYLGQAYKDGRVIPQDLARAKSYLRPCAAKGLAQCQYRLANLLFDDPARSENDLLQALAWYRLAGGQGLAEAQEIAGREQLKLTKSQNDAVEKWMAQLVAK